VKRNEEDVENLIATVQRYLEGIYDGAEDARLDARIEELMLSLNRILGDHEGWVYVFRILESDVVKIGFTSRDPKERLFEVQSGLPHILEIALVLRGNLDLENELHKRFAGYRLRGEWFLAHDALHDWLFENNARGYGLGHSTILNPFPWGPECFPKIAPREFAKKLYTKKKP
jgi:Meiotically up-regulated gene 113